MLKISQTKMPYQAMKLVKNIQLDNILMLIEDVHGCLEWQAGSFLFCDANDAN